MSVLQRAHNRQATITLLVYLFFPTVALFYLYYPPPPPTHTHAGRTTRTDNGQPVGFQFLPPHLHVNYSKLHG